MAGKHGGGAWKVAYADFVTAMMALFLVLWLTAQSPEIKQAVARSFTSPFSSPDEPKTGLLNSPEAGSDQDPRNGSYSLAAAVELTVLKRLSQQIFEALNSNFSEDLSTVVQIRFDDQNLRINVFDRPTEPIFEPDSSKLTKFGKFIFTTLAWQVTHFPEKLTVQLEGHTLPSEKSGRPGEGPWDLSIDRASAIRRLLVDYKVPPERIRNVTGFGAARPLNRENPMDESNRRVSLILKLR
ncbi:OmpA family protein [bacterium]|nr:OmpA family protein [bacterium]